MPEASTGRTFNVGLSTLSLIIQKIEQCNEQITVNQYITIQGLGIGKILSPL